MTGHSTRHTTGCRSAAARAGMGNSTYTCAGSSRPSHSCRSAAPRPSSQRRDRGRRPDHGPPRRSAVMTTSSSRRQAGRARRETRQPPSMTWISPTATMACAYKTSKLANVLFTREPACRWEPLGVSAAAAHPGMVRSQWWRSGPVAVRLVMNSPLRMVMRSPARRADMDTLVWLSTTPTPTVGAGAVAADRDPEQGVGTSQSRS